MMNEIEGRQDDLPDPNPLILKATAANASIFQPILKKETSVFEQIVMS
jgi:hypothetical protein